MGYFMLIVFSAYIGKVGEDVAKDTPEEEIKLTKTFAAYMEENQELATMINTVPGLNLDLLKMDIYKMDMEKDPLFRGEFDVVKQLLSERPEMTAAKKRADKLVDLCGPPKTGGTGIKQLRENIAESKLSYEIMDDAAQTFLKAKIQDNITKYFMLIVFSAYIGKVGEDVAKDTPEEEIKLTKTFA